MTHRVTAFWSPDVGPLPNSQARRLKVEVLDGVAEGTRWCTVRYCGGTGFIPVLNGGHGNEWTTGSPGGLKLALRIQEAGKRFLDLKWDGALGWWEGGGKSIKAQAEFVFAVLEWIGGKGAFQVVGNSGGAAAIAYALSSYAAEALLTKAVLCSTPMTRLDLAISPADPTWETDAATLLAAHSLTSPPVEIVGQPGSLLEEAIGGRLAAACRTDSIVHDASPDLDYSTNVVTIIGLEDTSAALPFALLHDSVLLGTHSVVEADAPHRVWDKDDGQDKIATALGI